MKLIHFSKRETSGLYFTVLDLVNAEQQAGHTVCIREPQGEILWGTDNGDWDVELVHSQLPVQSYAARKPRIMWMHGEAISSVGNGVSMKAICDLAPLIDAFICMRTEEFDYWNAIKRTFVVTKGINLERFKPLPMTDVGEKLSGSPAILYMEHWRGQRNPLPLVIAMQKVWKVLPDARLHLFNCTDKRMLDTFQAVIKQGKMWPYVRSLQGAVPPNDVNKLLNRVDIVVSCLYPFYARSIEAFGAGKPLICPGYTNPEYPWHCTLDPDSMANEIIRCWENYDQTNYRKWAEDHHDAKVMMQQSLDVYQRYLP